MRIIRLIAGYGAIVCALPYLVLKIIWLAGGGLGVADAAMMHDASMVALNALTASMDVIGIAMAVAFTHRWGVRLPAWLLLLPMWVATGLLARFAVAVPVAAIAKLVAADASPRVPGTGGPVQPWVYNVVYTSFAGMGVGLMVAFAFYARARWWQGGGQRSARHVVRGRGVLMPLAYAVAAIASVVALVQLAWMSGATLGMSPALVSRRTIVSHAVNAIDATMTIAAIAGIVSIIHARVISARAVAMAWIGSGSLFAWGLWHLINVLGNTALMRELIGAMALINYLALLQLISGLVMGIVMLMVLALASAGEDD